jgi:hypothetical protein
MTTRTPAEVIAGALRVQGTPHPDTAALAAVAALKGHGYEIKPNPKNTPRRRDCTEHPYTETPGGTCPSCGPQEQ